MSTVIYPISPSVKPQNRVDYQLIIKMLLMDPKILDEANTKIV